jgi:hypothetical protein
MTLVDILYIRQLFGDPGEITLCDPIARFIRMIIEIGDGISDGNPDEGTVGKRKDGDDNNKKGQVNELFHMGIKDREVGPFINATDC